jgi:hypothetical protein
MATNGPVNKDAFTIRQQEIVSAAAKRLNISYDNINSALIRNDLPDTISVLSNSGNFTTSVVPLYGDILNQTEKSQLIADRLQSSEAQQALESLNGVANLLGKNKQPVVSSAGTDRVRAETLANPTFDPSTARRSNAGLPPGAQNTAGSNAQPIVKFTAPNGDDTRVRIVVPSGPLQGILLNGPVLYPLASTNGVLFPYTPTISVNHGARYNSENLTHSNYAYHFYQSSDTESISITATFACKNSTDAAYVIAAQHFFRTVTKMFYGQDAEAGLPPPVLRLEGHGDYQFGAHKESVGGVPIIIESFGISLPEDVDYITAITNGATAGNNPANSGPGSNPTAAPNTGSSNGQTRVPIVQQFSLTCKPLYSRKSITGDFGFRKFAAGQLLSTGSRGGFI